jgi:hypothetical protein
MYLTGQLWAGHFAQANHACGYLTQQIPKIPLLKTNPKFLGISMARNMYATDAHPPDTMGGM